MLKQSVKQFIALNDRDKGFVRIQLVLVPQDKFEEMKLETKLVFECNDATKVCVGMIMCKYTRGEKAKFGIGHYSFFLDCSNENGPVMYTGRGSYNNPETLRQLLPKPLASDDPEELKLACFCIAGCFMDMPATAKFTDENLDRLFINSQMN